MHRRSFAVPWNLLFASLGMFFLLAKSVPAQEKVIGPQRELNPAQPDQFVVHEWGTFTSFSGSNGAQLEFRPLIDSDLPEFVFDRQQQAGIPDFSKRYIRARVRMETPVTYFYTNRERKIRASVEFPEGLLTEFYPPVVAMEPKTLESRQGAPFGRSRLDWGDITLVPPTSLTPAVNDPEAAIGLRKLIEQRILPRGVAPSNHYYHARETDSAFVHIKLPGSKENSLVPSGDFIEKFLFYRGVGQFQQPLHVSVSDDNQIQVTNRIDQALRTIFRVSVTNGTMTIGELPRLEAQQTLTFPAAEQSVNFEQLKALVSQKLTSEGLYEKEAKAMVNTWADSWFGEEGTRLFYLVPQAVTDLWLPLTISPAPDEAIRVMVGRVEIMTPALESQLTEVVRLHALERRVLAVRESNLPVEERSRLRIPTRLQKLGRLADPALVRIGEISRDPEISREAETLREECRAAFEDPAAYEKTITAR